VVKQDFTRIHHDIQAGDFFRNPVLKNSLEYANDNKCLPANRFCSKDPLEPLLGFALDTMGPSGRPPP
jgi:hypothetical protein